MLNRALAKSASALIFRHIYNSLIENCKLYLKQEVLIEEMAKKFY